MDSTDDSEALATLLALAHRKTGAIPPEFLVRHLLQVTAGGGWPVQRAAWEAVERRLEFARRDGLKAAARPATALGRFATRRAGEQQRPYRTLLRGLDPLLGSCDCADFARNSLGLCKHLLAVLDDLASRPRRWSAALQADPLPARLSWDPVRPLTGPGDWLERVRLMAPPGDRLERFFRPAADGFAVPRASYLVGGPSRRRLVLALLRAMRAAAGGVREPALLALLAAERERLDRLARQPQPAEARGALRGLRRSLYRYQIQGALRFLATGRLLLADDMGLGKTAQAIAACHVLERTGRVKRGLLIVPASLKEQWRREWQLFSDLPIEVVEGQADARRQTYQACRRGFLITNYEQVIRDLEVIHAWQADLVVLDEAQRIKNWATKTAAYVKRLRPPYRMVLTGTPMENRLDELASILDWVDDHALEPKWRLLPWHSELADGRREVVGARHLDTLRQRLAGCFLRRLRRDVLAQLPPRTDTVVPVEMTPVQVDDHAALDRPIAQLLAQARKRPLSPAQFLRLMQLLTTQRIIANGRALLDFEGVWPGLSGVTRPDRALLEGLSTPKLLELREVVAQIVVRQGRKAVIFSQWRRMLQLAHWAVTDLLEDAALRAAFFTGHESQRRRTQNIVDFHDDPATALLFATDAGGVGLNLQRAASCCVNLELPWNPAVLEQRIGRIHRRGQADPIDVYNLVSQGSIEARIAGIVASKQAFFSGLFDGDSNEVSFDQSGSFLSRLERLIEPALAPELPDQPDADEGAEVEALVVRADEAPEPPPAAEVPAVSAPPIHEWLGQLRIQAADGGGLRIEAPVAAAAGLAALFEGLAAALRAQVR